MSNNSSRDFSTIDLAALRGVIGGGARTKLFTTAIEGARKLINAGVVAAHTLFPGHHIPVQKIPEPKRIMRPVPQRPGKIGGSDKP